MTIWDAMLVHDCFTHMSFFQARFRLRLLLRSASGPRKGAVPFWPSKSRARRVGEGCASCGDRWERPKALKAAAWERGGNGGSSSVGEGIA